MDDMEKFTETIKGAMVGSDTKKVVTAASEGNLEEYKKALDSYNFPFTRDYSMVLLIFSPIVVVMQKIINIKKQDDSIDYKLIENLSDKVNSVLGNSTKFPNLCRAIGEGKGEDIGKTLNSFTEYKDLLKFCSHNKYGNGGESDKFINRAGKITRWITNKRYVQNLLIPFVNKTLGSKFAGKILGGSHELSHNLKNVSTDYDKVYFFARGNSKEDMHLGLTEILKDKKGKESGEYFIGIPVVKITETLRKNCAKIGLKLGKHKIYAHTSSIFDYAKQYCTKNKNFTYDDLKTIGNILQACKSMGYTTDEMKYPEMILLRKLMYVKCIIDQTDGSKQQNISVDQLDGIIGQTAEPTLETARNNLITLYGHRFEV